MIPFTLMVNRLYHVSKGTKVLPSPATEHDHFGFSTPPDICSNNSNPAQKEIPVSDTDPLSEEAAIRDTKKISSSPLCNLFRRLQHGSFSRKRRKSNRTELNERQNASFNDRLWEASPENRVDKSNISDSSTLLSRFERDPKNRFGYGSLKQNGIDSDTNFQNYKTMVGFKDTVRLLCLCVVPCFLTKRGLKMNGPSDRIENYLKNESEAYDMACNILEDDISLYMDLPLHINIIAEFDEIWFCTL